MNKTKLVNLLEDDFNNHLSVSLIYSEGLVDPLERYLNKIDFYDLDSILTEYNHQYSFNDIFSKDNLSFECSDEKFDLDIIKKGSTLKLDFWLKTISKKVIIDLINKLVNLK